jgi:hypothetical protein
LDRLEDYVIEHTCDTAQAARALGYTGTRLKSVDPKRYAEIKALSRELRLGQNLHIAEKGLRDVALDEEHPGRVRALELLGKSAGMFTEHVEISGPDGGPIAAEYRGVNLGDILRLADQLGVQLGDIEA